MILVRRILAPAALVLALIVPSSAQAVSAQHSYERLWHEDARFYAPGQPSPLVVFNARTPEADGDTLFTSGKPRLVEVSRGTTRGLRLGSEAARQVVEWEWARVFGPAAQSFYFPRPLENALIRYRRGHGSPVGIARARLPFFGQNPRSIFDPAAPVYHCPPGWHLPPGVPEGSTGCVAD